MRAVLKDIPQADHISIQEVDPPESAKGCLRVRVEAAGICGSDLHAYHWTKDYEKRYSGSLPVILGHEFTGIVESIGKDTEGFEIGQRIVARPGRSCNHCYCCLEGNDGICQNRRIMGVHFNGAMAGYVSVQASNCYALPEHFSPSLAAIFEPINVSYNAVKRAGPLLGKEIVIIGPGPLSYFISLFSELSGAKSLTIAGLPRDHARMKRFVAAVPSIGCIDSESALLKAVREKTGKRGADIVFEVSGSAEGFQQGLQLVRKSGVVVLVGIISDRVSVDSNLLVRGEITVRGALGASSRVWEEMIGLMRSLPHEVVEKFERAVTHTLPLAEAEEAFKIAEEGIGLKVLLSP